MKSIFFITTREPDKNGSADQITTFYAIEYLKRLGHRVDVEVLEIEEKRNLRFFLGLAWSAILAVFTLKPVQVVMYSRRYNKTQRSHKLKSRLKEYDRVYVHLIRPLGIFSPEELQNFYIGAQVSQYLNLSRLSKNTSNLFKKCFYFYEAFACKRFERYVTENSKKVNFVGTKDADINRRFGEVTSIPHGVDLYSIENQSEPEIKYDLIFIANFKTDTNRDALDFLLFDLFPIAKEMNPRLKLAIAGRNIPERLITQEIENVTFLGEVEDVHYVLQTAKVFVNPLRASAGMQNKVLTSMAAGVPVLASATSIEGMGIPNEIIESFDYSSAQDFIAKLDNILKCEYSRSTLQNYVINNWSWDALHKRWVKEFLDV